MKTENWIRLESGINETLKGKIVDKYAFNKGFDDFEEQSHLIIKFTDGTFICVGIEQDCTYLSNNIFDNKFCPELSCYDSIPYFIDIKENFHLEDFIRERIEMGVIEPLSDEEIDEIINKEIEKRRNDRYKQYLKLKEEFEKN